VQAEQRAADLTRREQEVQSQEQQLSNRDEEQQLKEGKTPFFVTYAN